MANVKVSQIGQTAVNQPFYELQSPSGRFVFATDETGQTFFMNRYFLRQLGVSTAAAKVYRNALDEPTRMLLNLNNNGAIPADRQFPPLVALGSGLAFVSEFDPRLGWKNIYPVGGITYDLN